MLREVENFEGKEKGMSEKRNLKEMSRAGWTTENSSNETVQTSCLMRIADATEAIAKPFARMFEDLNWYKERYSENLAEIKHLKNQIAGHKAAFTRLKNKTNENGNDVES